MFSPSPVASNRCKHMRCGFTLNEFNYFILFWTVAVVKYCAQRTRPTEREKKTALLHTFCLRRGTTWFRVEQCGVEKYFTRTIHCANCSVRLSHIFCTVCVCSRVSVRAIEMHMGGVDDRGNYKHDVVNTGVAVLLPSAKSVRASARRRSKPLKLLRWK